MLSARPILIDDFDDFEAKRVDTSDSEPVRVDTSDNDTEKLSPESERIEAVHQLWMEGQTQKAKAKAKAK